MSSVKGVSPRIERNQEGDEESMFLSLSVI